MGEKGRPPLPTGYSQYSKLEGSLAFRVFELLPITKHGRIHGRLHVRHLSSPSTYTAVSYRWGRLDPGSDKTIWVDGKPLQVRRSLWQLLKDIRKSKGMPFGRSLFLWIDAICINQHNTFERSSQVQLMPQIYQSSAAVVAYLGSTEWYFTTLVRQGWMDFNGERGRWGGLSLLGRMVFLNLSRRDYWTRLWIVPELILAPEIVLLAGRTCIEWESFSETTRSLRQQLPHTPANSLVDWRWNFREANPWTVGKVNTCMDIVQVLTYFKRQQCENPRDGLFGLLGFIEHGQDFAVDYSASVTAVFHSAWAHFTGSWRLAFLLRQALSISFETYRREAIELDSSTLQGDPIIDDQPMENSERWIDPIDARHGTFHAILTGTISSSLLQLPGSTEAIWICRCPACKDQLSALGTANLARMIEARSIIARRIYVFHDGFILYKHSDGLKYEPFACVDLQLVPMSHFHLRPHYRLILYAIPSGMEAEPVYASMHDDESCTHIRAGKIFIHPSLIYKVLYEAPHPEGIAFRREVPSSQTFTSPSHSKADVLRFSCDKKSQKLCFDYGRLSEGAPQR